MKRKAYVTARITLHQKREIEKIARRCKWTTSQTAALMIASVLGKRAFPKQEKI